MTPPPRPDGLREELDNLLKSSGVEVAAGALYEATVAGKSGDDVIVELGPRVQGMVPAAELDGEPEVGARLKLSVRGKEDGLWLFSAQEAKRLAAWEEMEVGSHVKGTVIGVNKGGLELKVGGLRAFCPASQVALHHVEDLTTLADETLVCEVLELDREKKRIVVSRRAILEEERQRKRGEAMGALVEGAVVRGRVTRLESFGAFVEIAPGIEGLLHVSNMAHKRVEHPSEMVKSGDEVEVQILSIQEGGKRIGLGKKQLEADPWDEAVDKLREGAVVEGPITRLATFGAFVELLPGVDGLVHVSQLAEERVRDPKDVVRQGQKLQVRILSIDRSAKRISLSCLTDAGHVLGSDEALASDDVADVIEKSKGSAPLGTNLGALFKKALDDKK